MRWDLVDRVLPTDRRLSVVEMGCGMGAFGARLAARYADYTGVEPATESAQVARERVAPYGGRVVADQSDLDPDQRFDLLCAFEVLEHLEDDAGLLRDWAQLLRPGGQVVVSVPADPDRMGPWDEKVGHYRRYDREQMTDVLEAAGLRPLQVQHYGYPFGYALETARNLIARRQERQFAGVPFDERTEGSGRQRQAVSPTAGRLRHVATRPFAVWQRRVPTAGPGLIGLGELQR
nr:class I SAM-dependent methyltransferase [Cellulomonas sp. RIT-PI-Y]